MKNISKTWFGVGSHLNAFLDHFSVRFCHTVWDRVFQAVVGFGAQKHVQRSSKGKNHGAESDPESILCNVGRMANKDAEMKCCCNQQRFEHWGKLEGCICEIWDSVDLKGLREQFPPNWSLKTKLHGNGPRRLKVVEKSLRDAVELAFTWHVGSAACGSHVWLQTPQSVQPLSLMRS